MVIRWWGSLVALALGVSSCAPADSGTSAEAYLDEVVAVIQDQALHADRIDWEHFAAEIDTVGQAATTADTYPLVQELLAALGDGHSSLLAPEVVETLMDGEAALAGDLPVVRMDGVIGYLQLPAWLLLPESPESQKYLAVAAGLAANNACGWILDLRGNTGGNVFVMLLAVAPLLGPGVALRYRSRDGDDQVFEISADGGLVITGGAEPPPPFVGPQPFDAAPSAGAVAVLAGPTTASSGEGIALAFRGRSNSRSFGVPTFGLPTGNSLLLLADGSALNLTTSRAVDFAGQEHEGPISPDEVVIDEPPDAAESAARAWLIQQESCAAAE